MMTVDQSGIVPGGTISGTYSAHVSAPTVLEGVRGSNIITSEGASPQITGLTITNTVAGDGTNEGTFTATLASLPASGTQQLLRFSDPAQSVADPTWRLR